MNTDAFNTWLKKQGYDGGTIRSRISNCQRVDTHEGDLDMMYRADKCTALISRLTYSTADERANRKPLHNIPMAGNIRNGTATLKQAVNLYIRFMEETNSGTQTSATQILHSAVLQQPETAFHQESIQVLDSYAQFMEYFAIDTQSFYQFGLDNTIFSDIEKATQQWATLKYDLQNDNPISIRSYGRQGQHSKLFIQLYSFLFGNSHIRIDPSNNTAPRNNFQKVTGYRLGDTLLNYQCSHIFGHTKNPLLFETVWNICFTPKLFDPLTGHEAKGPWPAEYQKKLRSLVFTRFSSLIQDYNSYVHTYDIQNRIQNFVGSITGQYPSALLQKFLIDATTEWAPISSNEEGME